MHSSFQLRAHEKADMYSLLGALELAALEGTACLFGKGIVDVRCQ